MKQLALEFLAYCSLALAGILARFGYGLGGNHPPQDPVEFAIWRRKQLWTAISEFLTIPAFGAAWISATHHWDLALELVIGGCLLSGALGFGFWLDALQRLINRKVDHV